MARSGEVYGGACGRTRTEPIHYSCACGFVFVVEVHRSVNVTRDPTLGQRLAGGTLGNVTCPSCGAAGVAEVPVVWHDEQKRQLILVLPPALRNRELEERAELLLAMSRDRGFPVPSYAREFAVAFGAVGLQQRLELLGSLAGERERLDALDRREAQVTRREEEAQARATEADRRIAEVGRKEAELGELSAALHEKERELEQQRAQAAVPQHITPSREIPIAGLVERALFGESSSDDVSADVHEDSAPLRAQVEEPTTPVSRPDPSVMNTIREAAAARAAPTAGNRPRRETLRNLSPPPVRDASVERWILTRAPSMSLVDRGRVRLLLRLPEDSLESYLGSPLDARVQLHRLPTYPLVVIAVGRGDDPSAEPLAFAFDLQRIEDRQVLGALAQSFRFVVDLYDADYLPVVQREVEQPLDANVRYLLTVAEEHLAAIPVFKRSYEQALAAWKASGYDRWGRREASFAEDSFSYLPSASAARKALDLVALWSEPDNEDYLLLTRSFPLEWWRRIRSRVAARCVELGLRLPDALVDLAVSEGLARSRKDLIQKCLAAFTELASGRHDLTSDQVVYNWRALIASAEEAGVALEPRSAELAQGALGERPGARAEGTGPRRTVPREELEEAASPSPGTGRASAPRGVPALPRASSEGQTSERHPIVTVQPRGPSAFGQSDTGPSLGEVVAAASTTSGGPPPRTRAQSAPAPALRAGATTRAQSQAERAGDRTPVPQLVREAIAPPPASTVVAPAPKADPQQLASEALLEQLEDTHLRLQAALELCRRVEMSAVGPVFAALRRMTRGEAVRVLPAMVKFGERAVPQLVDGLRSRKAYVRQGSALALGVLKSAEGIEPLCDLLLNEPTDVWREIARAVGEVGGGAVMSLAARLRDPAAQEPEIRERISWALAHVAGRGGRAPVETLAAGRDIAAVGAARRALELAVTARDNDAEVRGREPPRDVTLNRAFSRRFFEAMTGSLPLRQTLTTETGTVPLTDAEIMDADEELLEDDDLLPG